jgi:catechol 2,3-dioxygenase-like lactoylglutathione lyase family enzyme
MSIVLDHTIVRTRDKVASALFFARIFGLEAETDPARLFAGVPVNSALTLFFATSREVPPAHYAFRVDGGEFDQIFGRIEAEGLTYGSGPFKPALTDGRIAEREDGGRAVYFEDPNGHVLEVLTSRREAYEPGR